MPRRSRIRDLLGAICVVVAFGGLLVGRVLTYPLSSVEGTFLDRVAAKADFWDAAHRAMLIGALFAVPAALALARALRPGSPRLVDAAAGLMILAAMLSVGQFALDYAYLAAAQMRSRPDAIEFHELLRSQPFVDLLFYKLASLAWIGVALFAIALWKQDAAWRPAAGVVCLAIISMLAQSQLGPLGPRIATGLMFLGFSLAAWQMAGFRNPRPHAETRGDTENPSVRGQ
jgi:hypothetical protein